MADQVWCQQHHGALLAKLEAIEQRLERGQAWMDRHEAAHTALTDKLETRTLAMETRVTRLEGAVQTRTVLGTLGLALSLLASALGLSRPSP